MNIQYTGHNLDVTQALKDFTNEKMKKLDRIADNATSTQVTFEVDKHRQIAKATINLPGTEIHAEAESENMYKTVDALIDNLTRQIKKHKGKNLSRREIKEDN